MEVAENLQDMENVDDGCYSSLQIKLCRTQTRMNFVRRYLLHFLHANVDFSVSKSRREIENLYSGQ